MSEGHGASHDSFDGLWGWAVGGLAAGGIVLGLLIAAYAIGYNRGQDNVATSAAPAVPAPAATTATPTAPTPTTPAATTTTPAATTTTPAATTPTTATTATAPTSGLGPVTVTPALVSQGKQLFTADGCSGCHSLTGAAGAGPSLNGAAGRTVTLDTGQTVTADDAYLERSITDPDAEIVKGYHAGIMAPAVAPHDFADNPNDVRALVAFIKSQK